MESEIWSQISYGNTALPLAPDLQKPSNSTYHTHQNTEDPSASPPFETHNLTQNSILNNIPSQPPQNETKRMPVRLTQEQIPARFKDFIMQ